MARKKYKKMQAVSVESKYDAFICHSSHDRKTARQLAERLMDEGLAIYLDEWPESGRPKLSHATLSGLKNSRSLILLMSRYTFRNEWIRLERQTAAFRNAASTQKRFIPVLLEPCHIADSISKYAFIDWHSRSESAYHQLLETCRANSGAIETSNADNNASMASHAGFVPNEARFSLTRITILPDGSKALSGSLEKKCLLWDLEQRKLITSLPGHKDFVAAVAVASDGCTAVSGSSDRSVKLWDLAARRCIATLNGHSSDVTSVAISSDARSALSASADRTIKMWNLQKYSCEYTFVGHSDGVNDIVLSKDGKIAASASSDNTICIWDVENRSLKARLEGHTGSVQAVAFSSDRTRAVSGSADTTVKVWDLMSFTCIATFEGHVNSVTAILATSNGRRAISGASDNTIRVWEIDSTNCLATFDLPGEVCGLALTGDESQVVAVSSNVATDRALHVFSMPPDDSTNGSSSLIRYTNAKVLIVGESGVGKTGLTYRLAQGKFVTSISTDGVWVTQLRMPPDGPEQGGRDDGGDEREIWLWDFAGQADYKLMHQLSMDETALAVFVFNPQSEDPFDHLSLWDRDIKRAASRPFRKLLVAGRCDRGGLMVSRSNIDRFCREHGFVSYIETSAVTGSGCHELSECISENIAWNDIPWTASPLIFKLLKNAIIQLKDEGQALLRIVELKQQIELRFPRYRFAIEDLRAVVGLLAGPGVVWQLGFGDYVLLQPEKINQYAAALIRKVRAHADEIGCIKEDEFLSGDLIFQNMMRLEHDDEQIILRALHQTLVSRELCVREHTEIGPLLIFPSYFKRERPELKNEPAILVSYRFEGPLDEIYASLIVKLHHSSAFEKNALWRFAADFVTPEGKRVGVKMTKLGEGRAEIVVYFDPGIPDDTKVTFIRYVHDHLKRKDVNTARIRHYKCPYCHAPVENRAVITDRLKRGLEDIVCVNCEKRIVLLDLIERKFSSDDFQQRIREMEESARTSIDNESRELILVGNAFAIAGEAGQIFRPTPNSDWGIDGEIEFKDAQGLASGKRVYLQLKSGDSYIYTRKRDGAEMFRIRKPRHAAYWTQHAYPVWLVVRSADGIIRWMNVSEHLRANAKPGKRLPREIKFDGELFNAESIRKLRDESTKWV